MRTPAPVDLADSAAVAAWAGIVRGKVDEARPLMVEATMRKDLRQHGRRYLRRRLTRLVRDIGVLLDAIAPRPDEPEHGDPSGNGGAGPAH